jgi:hypothetical protein
MTLLDRFLTGEYTVIRSGPGYYKDGQYVPGEKETVKISGSLQPLNAKEMKLVSEGTRLKQYWKFYTDQPLMVIGTRDLSSADIAQINGDTYKVVSIESWQEVDLPYHKSILYREPEQ